MVQFDLIGVPQNRGCGKIGAEQGPAAIRSWLPAVEEWILGVRVVDCGDIEVEDVGERHMFDAHPTMKYAGQIRAVNDCLATHVVASLDAGHIPLTLGGDHSVALGSCSGTSAHFGCEDIAIVFIDAHTDINTDSTSPSGNIHGMLLSALMGFGDPLLTDTYRKGRKIAPQNMMQLAARDMDPGEIELIEREQLQVVTMSQIKQQGMVQTVEFLRNFVSQADRKYIHLSLDIDSVDPEYAPGTGTKVPGGLTPSELLTLIETVAATGKVCSVDLVELNPMLDTPDGRTAKLCALLLQKIVTILAKYRH